MSLKPISASINATLKLSAATLAIIFSSFSFSAEVYKWVDEHGNTHYADKKPNNTESKSIHIRNTTSTPNQRTSSQSNAINEQQARAAQAKNEVAQEAARQKDLEKKCALIRNNLKAIAESSRLRVEENGELRYLTPEEIATKKSTHEAQLAEFCQ